MEIFARSIPLLFAVATAFAQNAEDANAPAASPAQNRTPKQLPPLGVAISEKDRADLTAGVAELGKEIAALKLAENDRDLIPDVEIFHKAVDWALRYDEFYDAKQAATARTLLAEGAKRAAALHEGKAPWTSQTGLVVRGYRSKIDGSVQPFGVVVPPTWKGTEDKTPRVTWVWNHGRNEKLSELAFIAERMNKPGEFTPADTIVIHPYGRYCNATKFAGEVDVFEALAAAGRAYPVASSRLVNAGFSMGGASAWHLGAHHSGMWAVSHPGAGFAETAEYAGVFAPGKTPPPWWEVILYRWYDATGYVGNFANHPVLAYHGSEDKQGQSTAIMKRFAEKESVKIEEFIGPGVGHKYEPETKKKIAARIEEVLAAKPKGFPKRFHLATYTPLLGSTGIVRVRSLEKSWERADLDYEVIPNDTLNIRTKNINYFTIGMLLASKTVIDGQKVEEPGWGYHYEKVKGRWLRMDGGITASRTKNLDDGITGPIDHAFMDSFVFVKPTGVPLNPKLGEWTQHELAHATKQWRGIFRGDAPTVEDTNLTDSQIQNSNLVLWGDPSSNAVINKIANNLPVKWTKDGLVFGGKKYSVATHVPILIFPNPLNPRHYVVLNSGFTFSRAEASGTNSLQTPKLPDWAIVDTSVPPDDKFPGKIVDAGFFDEQWQFTTARPK